MKITSGRNPLAVGVDYREEYPKVCYKSMQMKEAQPLPLDFTGQTGRCACFRKVLSALKHFAVKEEMRVSFVLPDMEKETIEQYVQEACEAGFLREQLQILSETQSLVSFVMEQTPDIWQHRVWFLEFDTDEIKATWLEVNRRAMPMLVKAGEPEYWHVGTLLEGSRDEKLSQMAKERFGGGPVSSVFLAGTDFNARDYKKSREEICFHRRVFLAEQLHARGACAAAEDQSGKKSYLFLNEQTLLHNVGIRSIKNGKEVIYTLISAGCSWYDAGCHTEMLLRGEDNILEFYFQSMMGGDPVRKRFQLTDLPARPDGASRVLIEAHFTDRYRCEVKITDLGFGELYPASDLYWKESFLMEEQEDGHGTGNDL